MLNGRHDMTADRTEGLFGVVLNLLYAADAAALESAGC